MKGGDMKKTMEIPGISVQEPIGRDWLRYELTEDDFLLGNAGQFSLDDWENDE